MSAGHDQKKLTELFAVATKKTQAKEKGLFCKDDAAKNEVLQSQRLLLHPVHCPKGVSRAKMQKMRKEACNSVFKDLLDACQFAIACRRA